MSSNSKNIILIVGIVAALMIAQSFWLMRYSDKKSKTAYILTQKVFEGFDGTKQIKFKLKNQDSRQKRIIDSLAVEYKLVSGRSDTEGKIKAVQLKQLYATLYSKFQEDSEEEVKKYNVELWKQINQYINEYGKENSYSILYGADGTGTLMYADSSMNVSDKVIKYINKRYAGE